jgi:hypothetical protein
MGLTRFGWPESTRFIQALEGLTAADGIVVEELPLARRVVEYLRGRET